MGGTLTLRAFSLPASNAIPSRRMGDIHAEKCLKGYLSAEIDCEMAEIESDEAGGGAGASQSELSE